MEWYTKACMILIWLVFSSQVFADTLSVSSSTQTLRLSDQMQFFREPAEDALTLNQVVALKANDWTGLEANPSFRGELKIAYWYRLKIDFQGEFSGYIEIDRPFLDSVDIYIRSNISSESANYQLGDQWEYQRRPIEHNNILLPLRASEGEVLSIYLRVASDKPNIQQFEATLWRDSAFLPHNNRLQALIFIYFGVMLLAVLYNLFVFISVRESAYLFYVLHTLLTALGVATVLGYSHQYLWPDHPVWNSNVLSWIAPMYRIFSFWFCIQFLQLKNRLPWCFRLIVLVMLFDIVLLFLAPWGAYREWYFAYLLPTLIAYPLALLAGIILWKRGYKEARYYCIAWLGYIVAWPFYTACLLALVDYSPYYFYFLMAMQLLETVLLALALADRLQQTKASLLLSQKTELMAKQDSLDSLARANKVSNDALDVMKEATRVKEDFLRTINHEFRTPMNAVLGGLQVAQQHPLEHLESPLDIVQQGATDMMALVDDLLFYTELQAGKVYLEPRDNALKPALERLRSNYQSRCDSKGLVLNWHVDSKLPERIICDAGKLTTIISKLMDNAVKFTSLGEVDFTLSFLPSKRDAQAKLLIDIRDSGMGMSERQRRYVFESFSRPEHSFEREHGGIGIGFTIANSLLSLMQGDVAIESEQGKGSHFSLTIPLGSVCSSQRLADQACSAKATSKLLSSLPILVVEDNVVNQKVMAKILEKLHYRCDIANNGKEALSLIKKHSYSAVLMDLQMPIMDGFECTRCIRASDRPYQSIPVIAVTANLMDIDQSLCLDSGMNDFIEKPIQLSEIRTCLARYCQTQKALNPA
jgi:signal transduction histidine kinase/ActR/RegA family two-component response regulator